MSVIDDTLPADSRPIKTKKSNNVLISILVLLGMLILTGIFYPAVVTLISQVALQTQAEGSLVQKGEVILGSSLIGQNFGAAQYFHGRPSAAGKTGYDASSSSGSNLGVYTPEYHALIVKRIADLRLENPDAGAKVPADLVMASASGLDPDISKTAAEWEAVRVAKARSIQLAVVRAIIDQIAVSGFGISPDRVNVLALNQAMDVRYPLKKQ